MGEKNVTRAQKAKIIVTAVLVVAVIVLLLLNLEPVPVRPFFPKPGIPCAVLIIVTTGIGFVTGLLSAGIKGTRRKK